MISQPVQAPRQRQGKNYGGTAGAPASYRDPRKAAKTLLLNARTGSSECCQLRLTTAIIICLAVIIIVLLAFGSPFVDAPGLLAGSNAKAALSADVRLSAAVDPYDCKNRGSQTKSAEGPRFGSNSGANTGNFEPAPAPKRVGPGEGGIAHKLKPSQAKEEQRLKGVYGFNQLVSDEISYDRAIPDTRIDECRYWDYPCDLPKASVILVLHNEGWSTLLRNVHSIINRTPPELLEEVILVDDKSELAHLGAPLEEELKKEYYQGKVWIHRNEHREGLIRAKNNGAKVANGEVLVFLDSHCEVGLNWLPPLLAPIKEDYKTLSCPYIDGVNWDDFHVSSIFGKNSRPRGIFEWGFLYKEMDLKPKDYPKYQSMPYDAPTHAGGLFAIHRDWFKELGYYDSELWVWGGENYDLAFKVWMCGGRSIWVPCSRIAHVYRGHSCSSCGSGELGQKFRGIDTTTRNYRRVVEAWFDDEHKEFFYTRLPKARYIDYGDLTEIRAMQERLQCKNWGWFMENVAGDVYERFPKEPPNLGWGGFKNTGMNVCWSSGGQHGAQVQATKCHGGGEYRLNTKGKFMRGEWCIFPPATKGKLTLTDCKLGTNDGPWRYNPTTKLMKANGQCLAVEGSDFFMKACDPAAEDLKWEWVDPRSADKQKDYPGLGGLITESVAKIQYPLD